MLPFYRRARQASLRASDGSSPPDRSHADATSSLKPGSSGEGQDTAQSEARHWFDHSNRFPAGALNPNAMDDEVEPPFYQRDSDSSSGDKSFPNRPVAAQKPDRQTQSSSADDYRSVIDDLTVEIQNLKEELRKYKQSGPETLRRDKMFEIKVHGLPKRKKRELESTLRDFAARLSESPKASSPQRKKSSSHANRHHVYSDSRSKSVAMSMSMSKHASSSSGSNNRPADSAYASISTGALLSRPHANSRGQRSSDLKVENYLRDIPEGLYPRHVAMTEKEKKKLVVRRLEQIFTGKISGRHARRSQTTCEPVPAASPRAPASVSTPASTSLHAAAALAPTSLSALAPSERRLLPPTEEPSREAKILPLEHHAGREGKGSGSHDISPASKSHEDRTEFRPGGKQSGCGGGLGTMGANPTPTVPPPPEQRPTRLKDLDPDRVQNPSENMEYIRHLGIVPPELAQPRAAELGQNVEADEEGWVYLNLLCNMAQLHIMNVTPDFVRAAVTEFSTKFQLSLGGHKIRWRGGSEGTKFSSDSSGGNSQRSPDSDGTEGPEDDARRKRKVDRPGGDEGGNDHASEKKVAATESRICHSMSGIHYQPLFVRTNSANDEELIEDDPVTSSSAARERRDSVAGWHREGSTSRMSRRKRRHDGVIIYYHGAPFCTDLSGDLGDVSPSSSMSSDGQERVHAHAHTHAHAHAHAHAQAAPYLGWPSMPSTSKREWDSESSMLRRSRSEKRGEVKADLKDRGFDRDGKCIVASENGDDDDDCNERSLSALSRQADGDQEIDFDLCWSSAQQSVEIQALEPCGLGGVMPEDHFMVIVTTERQKNDAKPARRNTRRRSLSAELMEAVAARLATSTGMPSCGPISSIACSGSERTLTPANGKSAILEIRYVMDCFQRLAPEALPPPAAFFPPLSEDSWSEDGDEDVASSGELTSHLAHPYGFVDDPDDD